MAIPDSPADELQTFQSTKWPWKKMCLNRREFTRDGGRCKQWAKKIQKALGGCIIRIAPSPVTAKNASFIGPIRMKDGTLITDEFQEHFAVGIGDRIYDRITGSEGLPIREYQQLFDYADALEFKEWEEES